MTLVEQEVDRFVVAEAGPGTADAVVEAEAVDAVVIFEIEAAVGM